jgi:hypothetical protein
VSIKHQELHKLHQAVVPTFRIDRNNLVHDGNSVASLHQPRIVVKEKVIVQTQPVQTVLLKDVLFTRQVAISSIASVVAAFTQRVQNSSSFVTVMPYNFAACTDAEKESVVAALMAYGGKVAILHMEVAAPDGGTVGQIFRPR